MNRTIVGVFLGISVLLLVTSVLYFGVPQMSIGFTDSLASCNSRMLSWCSDGYSCTACSRQVLAYSLAFASGSTNIVYSADCNLGSDRSNGHTACSSTTTPPVIPPPSSSKCSIACSSNGYVECTSPSARRTCSLVNLGGTECLQWLYSSCPSGQSCYLGKCSIPVPVSYPVCDGAGRMLCLSNAQFDGSMIIGCTGVECPNGCSSNACISAPAVKSCPVSSKCVSDYSYKVTFKDCSTQDISCDSGEKCSGTSCIAITVAPTVDNSCVGVTCDDECSTDYSYSSGGQCIAGQCKYSSIVSMSPKCLPQNVSNETVECAEDLFQLDPCGSGKQQLKASCNDNKYTYIVYPDNNCEKPTFLQTYGLWIAGGIFALALILFIVTMPKKKKGRKR